MGVVQCDPSDARVSQFRGEGRRVVSLVEEASEREKERGRETPMTLLPKGDFILTGEAVARTFGLTPAVTSGMAELYDGPVGAVVWGEDMVRHAALMARGGGVGWRSIRTPPPRMLTRSHGPILGFGGPALPAAGARPPVVLLHDAPLVFQQAHRPVLEALHPGLHFPRRRSKSRDAEHARIEKNKVKTEEWAISGRGTDGDGRAGVPSGHGEEGRGGTDGGRVGSGGHHQRHHRCNRAAGSGSPAEEREEGSGRSRQEAMAYLLLTQSRRARDGRDGEAGEHGRFWSDP
ncbi:hypothetical protein BHM03_00028300 [Ensete ventricosum]|nr:hypothetical protein BHM03_00028300 [Ensete ventricosum]